MTTTQITKEQSDYKIISDQEKAGAVKLKNCKRCKFYDDDHGAYYCGSGFAQANPKSKIKEHRNSQKFCLSFLPKL